MKVEKGPASLSFSLSRRVITPGWRSLLAFALKKMLAGFRPSSRRENACIASTSNLCFVLPFHSPFLSQTSADEKPNKLVGMRVRCRTLAPSISDEE